MSGVKKIFRKMFAKQKQGTRPGDREVDLGSMAVTGIAPGDAGSRNSRSSSNRRPGRRGLDTPLGPRGRQRL